MKTTENTQANKVNKLLFNMFKENTGSHMLDSGGAYGRNHERNAKLTFKKALALPTVTHEVYEYNDGECELLICVNVFKYLINANLELDHICNKFNKLQNKYNDSDFGNFYGTSLKAGEFLESIDADIDSAWNTYNDSSQILSQVLQGAYVTINDEKYILLQIHGGCDVRGGYTDAKLFKFNKHEEYLPITDIYGSIDGIQVENTYNGYSMTAENGEEVKVKPDSVIELYMINE